MPRAADLFWPATRLSPAGFLFACLVVTLVTVLGAALAVTGRSEGWLVWLAGLWCSFAAHVNRRHDSGRGGGVVLLLLLVLAPATLTLGAAVAVVSGLDMPDVSASPTGRETSFAMFQVAVRILLSSIELDVGRAETFMPVLTAAALPMLPCFVASLLVGFGPVDPAPNRWGPPTA